MGEVKPHVYDPFEARCVSHQDLYTMFSEDGSTKANMLCLIDCLRYGFKKTDVRRAPIRIARSGAPASHDSVVTEVMARLGPMLGEQIAAAVATGIATAIPAPAAETPYQPPERPMTLGGQPGGNGGGNGAEAAVMEAPPVPAGYGDKHIHQPSEVFGHHDEVDPEDFKDGLSLAKDTTDLKPEPKPVPLTNEELAALRAQIVPSEPVAPDQETE